MGWIDENVIKLDFKAKKSKKYKLEAIQYNAIYGRELQISNLLKIYYFVFQKDYLEILLKVYINCRISLETNQFVL